MIRRSLTALAARLLPLLGRERWTASGMAAEVAELATWRPDTAAALAAIEAQDFVAADVPPAFDRFGLLVLALDAAVERDTVALQAVEQIQARPREGGRSQGLEWAYEELFTGTDRLQQAATLLRRLMPHEATIRALLAGSGEVRS